MTISRFLALYECYKNTLGISGHIAEIGVYKGASFLYFSKLIQIFEYESLTQVHGFDWFKGSDPAEDEKMIPRGSYQSSYKALIDLIKAQELQNLAFVHKLDVTTELQEFFHNNSHLQFKMVFFDAGMYNVVKKALPMFWERLSKGGYLILDQYNFEVAPGETKAVKEILPDVEIKTFPFCWMPTAYIIK